MLRLAFFPLLLVLSPLSALSQPVFMRLLPVCDPLIDSHAHLGIFGQLFSVAPISFVFSSLLLYVCSSDSSQ